MKKLLASLIVGLAVSFTAKGQAPPAGYPNINTNLINTLTIIQQYLLTNVTFLSNLQFSLSTNNNTWTGSNYFTTIYAGSSLRLSTNVWNGPTNTVDLNLGDQVYKTVTPCSVTGFANILTNFTGSVLLGITNAASTNITMTLLSSITSDDGVRSYVVTNGTMRYFSLRESPDSGTNNVSRTMF